MEPDAVGVKAHFWAGQLGATALTTRDLALWKLIRFPQLDGTLQVPTGKTDMQVIDPVAVVHARKQVECAIKEVHGVRIAEAHESLDRFGSTVEPLRLSPLDHPRMNDRSVVGPGLPDPLGRYFEQLVDVIKWYPAVQEHSTDVPIGARMIELWERRQTKTFQTLEEQQRPRVV